MSWLGGRFDTGVTAHGPVMSHEQSKTTPSFYAVGHLTNDALWIAPDLPSLIGSLLGDPEYRSRSTASRLTARERCACELSTRTQAGLLQAALADEIWSWQGASMQEIDRLTRAREISEHDSSLLTGMLDLGWLQCVGRMDSTGGVEGPRAYPL
jgi:hypothetical protein